MSGSNIRFFQNGNLPEKEGHIEIYDCESYISWVRTQVLWKLEKLLVLFQFCHPAEHGST